MRYAIVILVAAILSGCVSRPAGPDTPTMRRIEDATRIIDYPSQRLRILTEIARQENLTLAEQEYLVNAIFMGGFSSDRAEALVTLIRNPCCQPPTRALIRQKLKAARMVGQDQRRVLEVLRQVEAREEDAHPPIER